MQTKATTFQKLTDLLSTEADFLRAGRLADLTQLIERKDQLATEIEAGAISLTVKQAETLRIAARRSERLLGAALRGVRSARARQTAVARAAAGLETYDRRGHRNLLGTATGCLEKRA